MLFRSGDGHFSPGLQSLFRSIVDDLLYHDDFMLFADFRSYVDCQKRVSEAYTDQEQWTKMSILNVARMGNFSSDRSIAEYCKDIWKIKPIKVDIEHYQPADALLKI